MLLWYTNCYFDIQIATFIYKMQLWSTKCNFDLQNATLIYKMLLWSTKCYFGLQNATLIYKMLLWFTKCYLYLQNANLIHKMLFLSTNRYFAVQKVNLHAENSCWGKPEKNFQACLHEVTTKLPIFLALLWFHWLLAFQQRPWDQNWPIGTKHQQWPELHYFHQWQGQLS